MVEAKFLVEFHRKHFLQKRKDKGKITEEEQAELDYLINKYDKFLHRIRARESYRPF